MRLLNDLSINLTQLAGMLSFAGAAGACVAAAWRSELWETRIWRTLAFVNLLFFMEVVIGLRHHIHDLVDQMLMAQGRYSERAEMQEFFIMTLAIVTVIIMAISLIFWRTAGKGARIAAIITIALSGLFAIETVSLHALDAIFYRPLGPVLAIGWLWVAAAIGICLAARPSYRR